jgi:hypothetical protein
VTVALYRQWEADIGEGPKEKLDTLTDGEKCFISRRRAGKTIAWVSKRLGCCRYWVSKMEAGQIPAEKLLGLWAKKAA